MLRMDSGSKEQVIMRNKNPEETKNLIINTAARLFAKQGYDHTSIQDIINHLGGLSKGAIYYHFKSKEEIMMAVSDAVYADSEAEMMRVCRRSDLNGREKLKAIFSLSATNSRQKDMFHFAPDMLKNSQLLVMYLKDVVQKEAMEMAYRIIEEGIADGSIQTEYPKQLAEVLILLGNIWLNPLVYHCDPSELAVKLRFYQHLLKLLGLDIIEDEMLEQMAVFAEIYEKNINSRGI